MEQRNIILAFALSIIVLLGWDMLSPEPEAPRINQHSGQAEQPGSDAGPATSDISPVTPPASGERQMLPVNQPGKPAEKTITEEMVEFGNDVLRLRVNHSGRLIGALLPGYRQSLDADAKPVSVLETGEHHAMYIRSDFSGVDEALAFTVLSRETENGADHLVMQTKLSDGRIWQHSLRLQPGSYVVKVKDRITGGPGPKLFHQVVEHEPDKKASNIQQYQGPIGLMDNKLKDPGYEDLDKQAIEPFVAKGGWTGITNRYFIAAIIGDQARSYKYYYHGDGITYRAGMLDDGAIEGKDAVFQTRLYIGPKSIPVMKKLGVGLERSVDFGWFAFIAKPLHDLLLWFNKYISNFGVCIILLVVVIKLLFYWPTQKSYESMAGMRKLQPEMARIKEQYGDDRQVMGQKTMELYKKNKINPLGGCLPIVIQIPVFFSLYKVLLMSIEMRHAPLGGWIHDLSAQDPYFILPVLMGISMLVQQRLNPQPPDPIQARLMQFLPVVFTVMFLFFPSGLVLYWLVNNILSIIQQYFVLKARNAVDV